MPPGREELIAELVRLSDECDKSPPTAQDMNESGQYWAATYQKVFGSWNQGLVAAGFTPSQEYELSESDLLAEVKRLNEQVDRTPPLKRHMTEHGKHSARTYKEKFGSWNAAVEAAGFNPRKSPDNVRERPEACPLCSKSDADLDFHHWKYGENAQGCYLCRDCHERVHAGKGHPDEGSDWLVHAVGNLVTTHLDLCSVDDVDAIVERYNLPEVHDLVEMAIRNDGLYDNE